MATKAYRIEWNGAEVNQLVKAAVKVGLGAWAERHEQAARAQLSPGHGYLTGQMQRSIHAATPSYDWRGDFSPGSGPDLSGVSYEPEENGSRLSVAVGSGLFYAVFNEMRIAMVARGHDQTIGELDDQIGNAATAAGLG